MRRKSQPHSAQIISDMQRSVSQQHSRDFGAVGVSSHFERRCIFGVHQFKFIILKNYSIEEKTLCVKMKVFKWFNR
jgi:hypothetical protein